MREGWKTELATHFHFLFRVTIEIMFARKLDAWRMRCESLDNDFAFKFAASGASSDLGDKLEGAFSRAEIWDVQTEVGVENSNQSDVGKMQSFGDHLCADQDIDLFGFEISQDVFERVFAAHGIGIDASEAGCWENFL